eukprot:7038131-Ditylum_brightwellii.AAC.1
MKKRFKPAEWVDEVLAKDVEWRDMTSQIDQIRRDVNSLQKNIIAPKKKAKEPCDEEVAQMKDMQKQIKALEKELPEIAKVRDSLLNKIGNIVDPEVPISKEEEEDNLVVGLYPLPPEASEEGREKPLLPDAQGKIQYTLPEAKPLQHDDLLWRIGGYEPQRGQQ